jgi:hypothetical protein
MRYFLRIEDDKDDDEYCDNITVETKDVNKILKLLEVPTINKSGGISKDEVVAILQEWVTENLPPLPPKEVLQKLREEADKPAQKGASLNIGDLK